MGALYRRLAFRSVPLRNRQVGNAVLFRYSIYRFNALKLLPLACRVVELRMHGAILRIPVKLLDQTRIAAGMLWSIYMVPEAIICDVR